MKLFIFVCLIIFPILVCSQELPSNFVFKRETGEKTGIPFFHIVPNPDSIAYDAINGNTFEALGIIIQPERDKYGLMFMNAKRTWQISISKSKSCSLNIDGEKFNFPKFERLQKNALGKLKIESVFFAITKEIYNKLTEADEIIAQCGKVLYNLDQDNVDAIRYLANESSNDIERRKKN